METFRTLQEAIAYFADADRAFQYAINFRWEGGRVSCPRCGSEKHSFVKTRRLWFCYGCKKQFTLKVGTIFEDSPIKVDKWMMVMWMIANCKNGVSSYEIARNIGITQKSAWFMLHRIRAVMGDKGGKLGGNGPVEIDETFVGGKVKNMHKSKINRGINYKGGQGKAVVLGMLERGGRVKAKVIQNRQMPSIDPIVSANVEAGSHIMTDQYNVYPHLETPYVHDFVNHMECYVQGQIHTNSIENFWSLLKRSLGGTYISVEPAHLEAYVDEQAFRYNNRIGMNDCKRFEKVLGNVAGTRLTYKELTGVGAATSH